MPTLRCTLLSYRFEGCYHKFESKLSEADINIISNIPGLFKPDGSVSNNLVFLNECHNALWERFFEEPVYSSGLGGGPLRTRKDRLFDLFQTLKRNEGYLNSLRERSFGMQEERTADNVRHINLVRRNIVDILNEYVRLSDVYVWAKDLNGVYERSNDFRNERVERAQKALMRMMRHAGYRSRRPTNEFMQIVNDGESSIGRERKVYIERDGFSLVWED
ncbi:hypothetical protein EST38_g10194 [Candolleomyces aberdarensis]|uniref:Uncharacterized protein n=1 Tax=Candolleomyces aberdarensis TaxID=2316362 RepID=A0A4Q2D807_9AGAR|nr:hypothetical protein EST38_g10194 [Candolleomyces aberdarensis]